jgi:hypothetical protein
MVGEGKPAAFHVQKEFSLLRRASFPRLFVAFKSMLVELSHTPAYAVQHWQPPIHWEPERSEVPFGSSD